MTKEITQEERLDLTDKQVKAENLAYTIEILKNLEAITKGKKVVMEKEVKDCILKANCDLMAENERLKKQLNDYEKTLKEYADESNWYDNGNTYSYTIQGVYMNCEPRETGFEPAKRTLKKWEVK